MSSTQDPITSERCAHSVEVLNDFSKSYALLSTGPTASTTAAIFVHGFNGDAISTWRQFQSLIDELCIDYPAFSHWDLYFYGYPSGHSTVPALTAHLVDFIRRVFPVPSTSLFQGGREGIGDFPLKIGLPQIPGQYDDLVLIGHSSGAVLLRQALLEILAKRGYDDVTRSYLTEGEAKILEADLRLFAPAIFGFDTSHLPGFFYSFVPRVPPLQIALNCLFGTSAPYQDLGTDSQRLTELRRRTEKLAAAFPEMRALRASAAYGEGEEWVRIERFDCDPPVAIVSRQNHESVCKPSSDYRFPLRFICEKTEHASA